MTKLRNSTAYFLGTFNPIHYGHLMMADTAYTQLNLNAVEFILSPCPPHKNKDILPYSLRKEILKASIEDHNSFSINNIEEELYINNTGQPAYSINTILELKKTTESKLPIIIGLDSFLTLPTWHRSNEIKQHCVFILAYRNTQEIDHVKETHQQIFEEFDYIELDMPSVYISSTLIRRRRKNNFSYKYLMHPAGYEILNNNS